MSFLDDPESQTEKKADTCEEDSIWDTAAAWKEFWGFTHYAAPPILSYALDTGVELICLYFVGYIGELELAAAGEAFMLSNMTGHAVYTGFSTALGTLAAQAYGGQKYRMVGFFCQEAFIVVFASLIPIALLWINSGWLFEKFGVPTEIAVMAGQILQIQIMSLPPMALMQLIKVWMEAQGILRPITYISFLVCASCGFFQWLFVHVDIFGYGVYATPLAVTAAYTLGDIAFFWTIWYYQLHEVPHKTWFGWGNHTWEQIRPFARLSLEGAGMICLEWWSYEIVGIAGSVFGNTATAVQTVLINFAYFMYCVPEGIAIAANARVGHALGANKPVAAKRAALLAMVLAVLSAIIMVLPLWLSNGTWGSWFLTEEESMLLVSQCTNPVMLFLILNAAYGALSGILLGSGKQRIGLLANLFGPYVVGLSAGYILSYHYKWEVLGLWCGMVLGIAVLFVSLTAYVLRWDWVELAKEISQQDEDDSEELKMIEKQMGVDGVEMGVREAAGARDAEDAGLSEEQTGLLAGEGREAGGGDKRQDISSKKL